MPVPATPAHVELVEVLKELSGIASAGMPMPVSRTEAWISFEVTLYGQQ